MNKRSGVVKVAQIFNNGRSRAIRIPKEFEFDADQVAIMMDEKGDLIVHPMRKGTLLELLATMEPLAEEDWMPEVEDFLPEPVELDWAQEK